jgi:hypothetical protein
LSQLSVQNCVEIPKQLDLEKAKKAYHAFIKRNNFIEGKHCILERFDIDDTVTKRQIYRKWNKSMKRPATHFHTWVLSAPTRTFICGCTDFGIYDGTSAFNFIKGFVQTYYDGDDKAPFIRPQKNNTELDLTLDANTLLPDGQTMGSKLGCCSGLRVAFKTSWSTSILLSRNALSREILDLFWQAPPVANAIATIEPELNKKMTEKYV